MGNLPTNFGVSRTFRSRLIGQHLSDASHDLATLTFDLGGHGACRWYGSSCSVCVPSLNLVGLPVRKILGIYCVSINPPGDLDLWLLNPKTITLLVYTKDIPYTKFEHFGIIRFWVMLRTNGKTDRQTDSKILATPTDIVGVEDKPRLDLTWSWACTVLCPPYNRLQLTANTRSLAFNSSSAA